MNPGIYGHSAHADLMGSGVNRQEIRFFLAMLAEEEHRFPPKTKNLAGIASIPAGNRKKLWMAPFRISIPIMSRQLYRNIAGRSGLAATFTGTIIAVKHMIPYTVATI
jgi:hypothetical protein